MQTLHDAQALMAMEDRYGAHNYKPLDLVVERAQGVWLYDVNGRRYLDCISAYSAVNQGHCHPRILRAMVAQAHKATLVSRAMRNDRMPPFLKNLSEITGYEMALPMNTGAEAVETAIKLARRWGYEVKNIPANRAEIIVFDKNFHGRTTTIISASSDEQYRRNFGPLSPGFVLIPFGDYDALERVVNQNTCAILIEPIQGEGGVNVPPEGYLKRAWGLCKEHRVLFIADEIQTGLGRTGDLFAVDYDGIKPDIMVVGKALGGGFYPVSAALSSRALMGLFNPGDHGSTFGGNPLASAIAKEALDVITEEKLAERSARSGKKLMRALRALDYDCIREVRGRGLMIGVELSISARAVSEELLTRGIAAKDTHKRVLRLAPPLTIEDSELDYVVEQLSGALLSIPREKAAQAQTA
ncbi:MAG: ornithine--oxo-acid transaminase [Candidatus Eremiobacteraeota bacterium]|nr:ornithine--oxo-acid transaminase [Candidatus Eremiobacteraeota bacterium]